MRHQRISRRRRRGQGVLGAIMGIASFVLGIVAGGLAIGGQDQAAAIVGFVGDALGQGGGGGGGAQFAGDPGAGALGGNAVANFNPGAPTNTQGTNPTQNLANNTATNGVNTTNPLDTTNPLNATNSLDTPTATQPTTAGQTVPSV